MKRTKSFKFPVLTEEEYLGMVSSQLRLENYDIIKLGFPAWDSDNPHEFVKRVCETFTVKLPHQYLLDTGMPEWIWLVSGPNIIFLKR